jgi:predicted SAM-dependent methyltransferase
MDPVNEPIPKIPPVISARQRLRRVLRPPLIPLTYLLRRRIISSYLALERHPKLHLGCGAHLLQGWLNADLSLLNRGGRVYVDAREKLPFPSNSFAFIFTEHFISSLTLDQGVSLFREFQRILRPGGVVRTSTPDLAALMDVYLCEQSQYRDYVHWVSKTFLGSSSDSRAMVINNFFYGFGLRFIYDLETLTWALKQAGFSRVVETKIGESDHPELRAIEGHGLFIPPRFNQLETMVLEATKE